MPTPTGRVLSTVVRIHDSTYQRTNGRVGHRLPGAPPSLLLHTVGAKSGQHRTNTLTYARDGDDFLVVGSNGGGTRNPAWYHNARKNPGVEINIGPTRLAATARPVLPGEEGYPHLWRIVNANNANRYETYQGGTARPIPVVVLTPQDPAAIPPPWWRRAYLAVLRLHDTVYRRTNGRIGHRIPGLPPNLLLHTVGAKTGLPRSTSLMYARDGGAYLVVASRGGHPRAPGWYHNLRAHPDAEINVGTMRLAVKAEPVQPGDADYARLWQIADRNGGGRLKTRQSRTSRPFPIVVLTPQNSSLASNSSVT